MPDEEARNRRANDRVLDGIEYQLRALAPLASSVASNTARIDSLDRHREDVHRWITELKSDTHDDIAGLESRLMEKIELVSRRCDTFHSDWEKSQERSLAKTLAILAAATGIIAACIGAAATLLGG